MEPIAESRLKATVETLYTRSPFGQAMSEQATAPSFRISTDTLSYAVDRCRGLPKWWALSPVSACKAALATGTAFGVLIRF